MSRTDTTLTTAEMCALYDLIAELTGGNPENVFAWDGTDDIAEPRISAMVKVFRANGRSVPVVPAPEQAILTQLAAEHGIPPLSASETASLGRMKASGIFTAGKN